MPESQDDGPRRHVELREMTATVANPRHDRRRKYGNESVAALPSGARFALTSWDLGADANGVERRDRHATFTGSIGFTIEDTVHRAVGTEEWLASRQTLLAEIVRSSRPATAASWRETCESVGETGSDIDARVLQRLYLEADPVVLAAMRAALAVEAAEG